MYQGNYSNSAVKKRSPQKRRTPVGTIVFYSIFCLFIVAFAIAVKIGLNALDDFLVRFELSQPTAKSEEVFNQLFADPDWAALYEKAGEKDTPYEDAHTYQAYMQQLVRNQKLSCLETSAGLDNGKKYIVQLGNQKIADFTLQNVAEKDAKIPDWAPGEIHLFYTRSQSAFITVLPGRTVQINGVTLDPGKFTVQTCSTEAEKYLPEGLHGYQDRTLFIDGLLMRPEIKVTDAGGKPVEVTYDEKSHTFTEVMAPVALPDDVADRMIGASKTLGKCMILAEEKSALYQYFNTKSNAWKDILALKSTWMQKYSNYHFGEPEVADYYRYSDSCYSARISMILYVTRTDGTEKEYSMNSTYFWNRNSAGKWRITDMTNKDVQARQARVKLNYICNDQLIQSEFVDAEASSVTLPEVSTPDGMQFIGWFQKVTDAEGKVSMKQIFSLREDHIFHLKPGTVLAPMTLYAQFEKQA